MYITLSSQSSLTAMLLGFKSYTNVIKFINFTASRISVFS